MDHLMLDLETWGLRRGHAIRAIGAVPFDPTTGEISDHCFYQNVGFLSQEKIGLTKLQSTADWWDHPNQDMARALLETDQDSIHAALAYFGRWLRETYPELEEVQLWTRGNMDVEVLEGVFEAVEIKWPFNFRKLRDSRAILALVEYDTTFGVDMTFKGTPHYALDDARHEAYAVSEVYKHRLLNVPADHLAVMLVDDGVRVPGFTSLTDAPDLVEEPLEGVRPGIVVLEEGANYWNADIDIGSHYGKIQIYGSTEEEASMLRDRVLRGLVTQSVIDEARADES